MKSNISRRERAVRLAVSIGLVVVALLGSHSMTFVYILYGSATLILVTVATAYCPAHHAKQVLHSRISRTPPL